MFSFLRKKCTFLHFCLAEDLYDGRVCVEKEWGKAGFSHPCGFGNILLSLRRKICRICVKHVIPPCVLQMPDPVAFIAMVSDADEISQDKFVDACLFLNLAQSCDGNIFAGILMAFREIP